MFILSILCAAEHNTPFGWMKPEGAYPGLDAAIAAAINADVALAIRGLAVGRISIRRGRIREPLY
jgi:hypothetical protein